MKHASTALVLCLFALPLMADTLYLRDGRTLHGTFISGNSRQVRFLPDNGRTQIFSITSIDRLSFGDDSVNTSSDRPSGRREQDNSQVAPGSRSRSANNIIPAGTVVTVRTIDAINSDRNGEGQTFRASLDEPLLADGREVAPKGADATVQVVRVKQSGAVSGTEEIALGLSEINVNGRRLLPDTQHAEVSAKSRGSESAKVIGGTAVVGAIVGAIAGGGKGAAIGAASGAGAGVAIQAIRGQRIEVPSESRLDFTLAAPLRY